MTSKRKNIIIIGCFDTKAEDFNYLYTCLKEYGVKITTINTGILGSTDLFPVHINADAIAKESNTTISALRTHNNRSFGLDKMGKGAAIILSKLVKENKVDGVIGMGGGGGTYLTLKAMQSVPFGVPKLCVSTLATKDLSMQIKSKDIVLMPSVVDVAGLNTISRVLISQAAAAIVGMANASVLSKKAKQKSVAISVFGNTTICANTCSKILKENNFDVHTFHAVGTGGKTMEDLTLDGCFDAILDITTTELADDLCGGICSAGSTRLTAASIMGIPQVVVPGCMDMVNFGSLESMPATYKNRQLFSWAPNVTLMRTNAEENKTLGKLFAEKLNTSKGKVIVLLPLGGISKISGEGEVFHNPKIDIILFDAIKENLNKNIPIIEVNANINTLEFGEFATKALLDILKK